MNKNSKKRDTGLEKNSYEEKIKSLHTGAALIGRAGSTNELYNAIIQTMVEILGYPRSGLAIPDEEHMHFVVTKHESKGMDFTVPRARSRGMPLMCRVPPQ